MPIFGVAFRPKSLFRTVLGENRGLDGLISLLQMWRVLSIVVASNVICEPELFGR